MDNNADFSRATVTPHQERLGESTRMFISHVKQYFDTLPIVTVSVMVLSTLIATIDLVNDIAHVFEPQLLTKLIALVPNKVVYGFQVHRLLLYPFGTLGFLLLITNFVLLVPYLTSMERRYGSMRLIWILGFIFTVIPGLMFVALLLFWEAIHRGSFAAAGLSSWTVGLAFLSSIQEQQEGRSSTRLLFGAIAVPGHVIPYLIIVFYVLLVPDTSLLLHLLSAGMAYLYANSRIPSRLVPEESKFRHYESHQRLRYLTESSRYISVDSALGETLPIVNPNVQSTASLGASSQRVFPGQGHRLGDQ